MKVDFDAVLKNIHGDPIKDVNQDVVQALIAIRKALVDGKKEDVLAVIDEKLKGVEDSEGLKLETVALNAVLSNSKDKVEGSKKMENYVMAKKIKAKEDLSITEIGKLKEKIGDHYTLPVIVGQAWELIEAASK